MTKVFITDVDGAIGDCSAAAREIGLHRKYEIYKNEPKKIIADGLPQMDMGFSKTMNYLARNFEFYPGVKDVLKEFKKNGYEICFCSDNFIFSLPENQYEINKKLEPKNAHPDEFFTTMTADPDGPMPIRSNGDKVGYVNRKFKKAEKGVLIVDDVNDFEAAAHAKRMGEERDGLLVIKTGDNSFNLFNGHVDTYEKYFANIPKNRQVIEGDFLRQKTI